MISNTEKQQLLKLVQKLSYDRGRMGRQRSRREEIHILRRKLRHCEEAVSELLSRSARRKLEKRLCCRYPVELAREGARIHTAPRGFKLLYLDDKESIRSAHHLGITACRSGYHYDSNPFERLQNRDWSDLVRKWYRGYLNQWRSELTLVATFDRIREEKRFNENILLPKGGICYRYIVNDDFKYIRIHPISFKAYDWKRECWFEYWGPEEDEFGKIPEVDKVHG